MHQFSITSSLISIFLFKNVDTHANILLNLYFIFNFSFCYFNFYFYFSITITLFHLILYYFDDCNVDTHANILFKLEFHFWFHFPLLHFLFLFFLFNHFFSFYFCAVSTTAMLTLVPIFSGVVVCTQVLYSDCDSVHSLYREWSQWRPLQMAVNCWTKNWDIHTQITATLWLFI